MNEPNFGNFLIKITEIFRIFKQSYGKCTGRQVFHGKIPTCLFLRLLNPTCHLSGNVYQSHYVIRLRQSLSLWLCWAALVLASHAQVLSVEGPPPPSGVSDTGGFFNRDIGAVKRISEKLLKMEQDHGFKIYLVVEPVLITTSAPEWAEALRKQWLPDGNGIVLVYESNSRTIGVGWDMTGGPDLADKANGIPSHETAAMLNRAMDSGSDEKSSEVNLESLVSHLVDELDGYFTRRVIPPPADRSMKIGMLVVGTLSVLGLVAIGLGGLARHSSMTGSRSFRFPVVDRPERLGAPCGSSVTARSFGPKGTR